MRCRRFRVVLTVVSVSVFALTTSARGATLVYEGFNYAAGSDIDTPLNAGTGFSDAWTRAQQGGTPTIYDESLASWPWDGVVAGFPTSPAAGSRYVAGPGSSDRLTAQRVLGQSAGDLASADNTLWASVVWHQTGSNYGRQVGFALGTDGLSNRSRNVDTSGSYGSGDGDAIGVGGAINTLAVTPIIFDNGVELVRTTTGATNVATNQDNVVVLKYVFADGASDDEVFAYRFTEADIFGGDLTEAVFNANAISAAGVIDQNTLNILSFSQSSRGTSAVDEIRLGDTFADVIATNFASPSSLVIPEPASLMLLALGVVGVVLRRR